MSTIRNEDCGSHMAPRAAGAWAAVAGSGTDNVDKVSAWVDRAGFLSGAAVLFLQLTIAAAETLTISGFAVEDADDDSGTNAATYASHDGDFVVTAPAGGLAAAASQVKLRINLMGARRYIRIKFHPDLSRGATDTVDGFSAFVLGGSTTSPVN